LPEVQIPLLEQAETSEEVKDMTPEFPHPRSRSMCARLVVLRRTTRGFESPLPHHAPPLTTCLFPQFLYNNPLGMCDRIILEASV
jgi:hypothetical protein